MNDIDNFVPYLDRLLIEPIQEQEEEKTASGIIIPKANKEVKLMKGKVIKVGDGKYENGQSVPMKTNVGDFVLFSKYSYDEIEGNGKKYFILSESAIIGKYV